MDIYDVIYEAINDLYQSGSLTLEEAEEVNELAYNKYCVESSTYAKAFEKDPNKYIDAFNAKKQLKLDSLDNKKKEIKKAQNAVSFLYDKDKIKRLKSEKNEIKKEIRSLPSNHDITSLSKNGIARNKNEKKALKKIMNIEDRTPDKPKNMVLYHQEYKKKLYEDLGF